jgi:putative ABC transport system permease protein
MNIVELINTVLTALSKNKLRTFLTMLGVIIGVFSVVSLVSVGAGLENFITERFNALGSNLILVAPGKADFSDDPAKYFSKNKLADEHIELIERYVGDSIEAITPSIRLSVLAKNKTKTFRSGMIAGNSDAFSVFDNTMSSGRFFNNSEVRSKAKVVVIGPLVREELFGAKDAIGESIKINEESYVVIGETTPKSSQFDDRVFIPYTTAMEYFEVDVFSSIGMKAKEGVNVDTLMKQVELALLRDLEEDDFSVLSQSEILGTITNVIGVITVGVGAIAGISLLAGGIGIMNIMFVTVTERTREIGLRKALGATPNSIGVQFLLESTFLSLTGGLIGLLLSLLTSILVKKFVGLDMSVSLWSVILAFGFSAFVGMVFGTYPAIKAAKKDPIDALRYE